MATPPILFMENQHEGNEIDRYSIGQYCKYFRKHTLGITLTEMEDFTGFGSKTLSAFENGRSSNMLILLSYYGLCSSPKMKDKFIYGLYDAL